MPTVLIVDDERDITSFLGAFFERGGHQVLKAHTGEEAVAMVKQHRPDLVLLDLRLPDISGFEVLERVKAENPVVIMITGHGDVSLAVRAMQSGAESFLTKPIELAHLGVAAERAFEKARLRQMNRFLTERRGRLPASALLGSSPPMRELAAQIDLLARSDRTTVLLAGESGTGKGRVAEAIHRQSPRAGRQFIEVNCAALTAASLDSELFGQEQPPGSETPHRPGLLEVADGGTLFLDEIGDLDAHLQPKLLRVLEGKSFRRLGGTVEVQVDVRLIAATSKDLVSEVTAGRFREDLYYRLSVMPINLPPLRARAREDLVELIGHLLDELRVNLPDGPAEIEDEALERLLKYSWPGNIREMRNVLERALIIGRGAPALAAAHLPLEVRDASGLGVEHHVPRTLAEVERQHIDRTLRALEGNRTRAAKELGISRATLIKKVKEYDLEARPAPRAGGAR
ncbi:MAG TPA: sigma-54 dependent transcriptional regulator [Gemmatimonadaceae bacterium]|jgi:two-component system response regulator HydG|nr:sigma-54 dependent transcriptional regulator [Gemmatimonadaceae bacterium]